MKNVFRKTTWTGPVQVVFSSEGIVWVMVYSPDQSATVYQYVVFVAVGVSYQIIKNHHLHQSVGVLGQYRSLSFQIHRAKRGGPRYPLLKGNGVSFCQSKTFT